MKMATALSMRSRCWSEGGEAVRAPGGTLPPGLAIENGDGIVDAVEVLE